MLFDSPDAGVYLNKKVVGSNVAQKASKCCHVQTARRADQHAVQSTADGAASRASSWRRSAGSAPGRCARACGCGPAGATCPTATRPSSCSATCFGAPSSIVSSCCHQTLMRLDPARPSSIAVHDPPDAQSAHGTLRATLYEAAKRLSAPLQVSNTFCALPTPPCGCSHRAHVTCAVLAAGSLAGSRSGRFWRMWSWWSACALWKRRRSCPSLCWCRTGVGRGWDLSGRLCSTTHP